MRKWLLPLFLFLFSPALCFSQGVRLDGIAIRGTNPLQSIGNAQVTICTSAGTGNPCTPLATTYTSATLATPCPGGAQLVLAGTSTCVATADNSGNYGAWVAPGKYILTITVVGTPGYSTTLTLQCPLDGTCTWTQPQTFTGAVTAKQFNNEIYVDGTTYLCNASGINSAITAAASSIGGIVHVGSNCIGMTIASNLWASVTNPVKVIWEPTATFTAQQFLPTNTEVTCAGWQTVLTIGATANWPQPEALFVNALYSTYTGSSGHDTGISVHDCFVDGSLNTLATEAVGFRGADNSQIYNLYMKNISHNGVDLRDGNANNVHDNWCVGCGTFGAPYHAFGGGITLSTGIFLHNKFTRNHASGGGTLTDHFDIYGQAASGRCGFNVFSENTSDASPSQSFFMDTCNNNTFSENISRNAVSQGFAVTSGVSNLDGAAVRNTYAGNIINNPGAECYRMANNANNNSITGGTCLLSQHDGILILDSSYNIVSGVNISGPGQAAAATYSGIKTTNTGAATQTLNKFSTNIIQDLNTKMHYGVEITPAAGGTQFQTQSHDNLIIGGSAGSIGNGVQDTGIATVEYGDQSNLAAFFFKFYGMADVIPGNDNATNLGRNGFRWGNLHLGGYLSPDGGTSQITLPFSSGLAVTSRSTSQKSETGTADANVLTVTPSAVIGTYRACFVASVSSATAGVISWTLSWTDSNGNAQANIAQDLFQDGTAAPATSFTTSAAGNYHFCREFDVNNAAAAIVVKWVGGGTTAAKVSATIERII